ncbi:hypothetical protein QQF64_024039 [Cirrhinus molitorella]|uniref:Gypsy retrotransposon integrase-like protein 1 n=1 Tax=Cirrhinus molitorella TaxID=172907 RepID=A0ABR3NKQ5_9TELE
MLDSGSMATTLSAAVVPQLREAGVLDQELVPPSDIILVGCGGKQTCPVGMCDLKLEVYGLCFSVPVLIVSGQIDQLIVGTNVLKPLIREMKSNDGFWRVLDKPDQSIQSEDCQFLRMLSSIERWRGSNIPDKVGTLKSKSAVVLQPMSEHLVWGRLPPGLKLSVGSTVVIEPSTSRCVHRNVLVGRVISPLWGDGWLPVKMINPTNSEIVLRRNAKLADIYPCIALEDFDQVPEQKVFQNVAMSSGNSCGSLSAKSSVSGVRQFSDLQLDELGLKDLNVNDCEVSPFWRSRLVDLIKKYECVFSRHSLDCGEAKGFCHRIRLTDDRPFRLPYRRLSPAHYHKLKQTLDEMEQKEIIRKSSSEFASPLVLVWKKNGDLRLCTDFRWLNARTVKDAHPLPHQADVLAALGGNALFSTMDLTSGYYNIPLHEEDKKYTAFSSPLGLHEYNRLPQGLWNSPASFMRMMLTIFGDQNFMSLLCYLDDLLVFGKNEEESLQRLEMVFQRLKEHNLKLSPSKCRFLRRSVKFLGHIVSQEGVASDPMKVEAITNVSEADLMEADGITPSVGKIRSFLGMVIYYQHFIENCSMIAKPLFQLTTGQKRPRKGKGVGKRCGGVRKLTPDDWTDVCRVAFENLKAALVKQVLLAHPDFSRPFILSVDASTSGLGVVLSQVQEGHAAARPIVFASKSLNHAQSKYPAHRLEFLAMKWAICDKFSHWLRGHRFTVWTDNNPLKYILTKPKLDACEQRWVAKLAPFEFDIQYIPGSKNVVADALSREPFAASRIQHRLTRTPYEILRHEAEMLEVEQVQGMFHLSCERTEEEVERMSESQKCPEVTNLVQCFAGGKVSCEEMSAVLRSHRHWEEAAAARAVAYVQHLRGMEDDVQLPLTKFTHAELLDKQCQDPVISRVRFFVERGRRPSRREKGIESKETVRTLRHWGKFTIKLGILYRVSKNPTTKKKIFQYIVPAALRGLVLYGVHDDAGHQGQHRTLWLARQRFYWNTMDNDTKLYVSQCKRCVLSKTPEPEARAPLVSITTTAPLELVCIDFWTAENVNNISRCVARIHSDKGANFESSLIAEMLQLSGVAKSHTTPYHPMGNGQTERFNRTLGGMIRHETTGYPPFFLMFGRTPRLPVDVLFESVILDGGTVDVSKYVQSLGKDLREAMSLAQQNARHQQNKQAEHYNLKCKGHSLELGDRVLLANKGEKGKRKLADRWESTVYIVVSKNCSLNTYKIRHPVTGRVKTVHRNLLMPVNFLPLPAWDDSVISECDLSSNCDSSHTDCQEDDSADRTSQWIADLDEVAGMGTGELENVTDSVEHEICDDEVGQHTKQDDVMECQDNSGSMSNASVSLCQTSNDEIPPVLDVQNDETVSEIVMAVSDHACDVSEDKPVGAPQREDSCHVVTESHEQQRTRKRCHASYVVRKRKGRADAISWRPLSFTDCHGVKRHDYTKRLPFSG